MHRAAHRNIAQRQRIARLDRRIAARLNLIASFHALRRNHVTAFAVCVQHQRDKRRAVGIVLQALDGAHDAIFVTLEIDQSIMLTTTATHVTSGDATIVVAAARLVLIYKQRLERVTLVQIWIDYAYDKTAAGRSRFTFYDCHFNRLRLFRYRCKVDVMTLLQAYICFLPARLSDSAELVALDLAFDVECLHAQHLYAEQLLYRLLHFQLCCARQHFEHYLIVRFGTVGSFLGNMWTEQNLINTFRVHPSISSNFFSADTVTITFSKAIRLTGSTPCTSRTSTLCRLREARYKFSVTSSDTISASCKPYSPSALINNLVFG